VALDLNGNVVFSGTGQEVHDHIKGTSEVLFPKSQDEMDGGSPGFWLDTDEQKQNTMRGMIMAHGKEKLESVGIVCDDLSRIEDWVRLSYQLWFTGHMPMGKFAETQNKTLDTM
jgi:hypothetical protein